MKFDMSNPLFTAWFLLSSSEISVSNLPVPCLQPCVFPWRLALFKFLGMSQPGWEDLGWENASYCPLYQVILFDWMACLNNACNRCKLQLQKIMLTRGCHDEHARPTQLFHSQYHKKWHNFAQWFEARAVKTMVQRKSDHKHPQNTLPNTPLMDNGAPAS